MTSEKMEKAKGQAAWEEKLRQSKGNNGKLVDEAPDNPSSQKITTTTTSMPFPRILSYHQALVLKLKNIQPAIQPLLNPHLQKVEVIRK